MVQIKTGQSELFCGPNCGPPNSSHFRNLKRLKIDKVVSQRKRERERNRERERKTEGKKSEGKRQESNKKPLRKCELTRCLTWKEGANA